MENEFSIGSRSFKVGKVHALKQFHIVRRMAPILGEIAPKLPELHRSMKNTESMTEEDKLKAIGEFAGPIMSGLSKLGDKDSEYVLMGLLEAVEMKQEQYGNWARVSKDGRLMLEDLDLPTLMQAAGRAFMFNLSGFFTVLPQVS